MVAIATIRATRRPLLVHHKGHEGRTTKDTTGASPLRPSASGLLRGLNWAEGPIGLPGPAPIDDAPSADPVVFVVMNLGSQNPMTLCYPFAEL